MFAPIPEYKSRRLCSENKALLLTQRWGGIFQSGGTVILGPLKQKSQGAYRSDGTWIHVLITSAFPAVIEGSVNKQ